MAGPNDLRLQFLMPTATNKGPELWPAGAKSWAPRTYDEAVAALRVHAGALDAAVGTPPGSSGPNAKAMEAFINASSRAKVIAQAASLAAAAPEGSLQAQTLAKGVLNERATPNLTPMSEIAPPPSATYTPRPMPWLTGGTATPSSATGLAAPDFMGGGGQSASPAPAAGTTAPTGEPEYLGILRKQVAAYDQRANYFYTDAQDAQAAGNTMAYQSAMQNAMAYEKLRDDTNEKLAAALGKTGAGGISADTAANIASAREGRAQAQAQFEAQMAWDRQQAMQHIREAQATTMQNLATARQRASEADAQFMTQNRQSIFPMGTQYAPGLEPGGAFGQLMSQLSGKPYQGAAINPQPINLKANQDLIESQVPAILEQMKSWGVGG